MSTPGSDRIIRVDVPALDPVESLRIATGEALSQVENLASGPSRRFLAAVRALQTKQRELRLARCSGTVGAR